MTMDYTSTDEQANLIDVSVESGKYRIVMPQTGPLHAYRHGEEWRDLTGDKMVYALASELQNTREERDATRQGIIQRENALSDLRRHVEMFINACDNGHPESADAYEHLRLALERVGRREVHSEEHRP
jgi:predicted Ser/Thr protein kinase